MKRSSTARSASVDGDLSEPPLDVVKSRNGRPGRTLRQGGGDPIKEEHTDTSLLPGSPSSAAGVGERRQRSPPSKLKTLEKRLEGALGEIADLTNLVNDFKSNNAKAQLQYLEEYFTCALCLEIMACPYSLHARHCGHTFCATCILKWFFSRLHRGCGGWHESVDCPVCRSALYCTPDLPPRSDFTFPFIPNRTMDGALQGLVNGLTNATDKQGSTAVPNPLADWCEEGHARQEWIRRDKTGRTEMTSLANKWANLQSLDFVKLRERLGV